VIAIVPSGPLFEKSASNLQGSRARRAVIILDETVQRKLRGIATETIVLPAVDRSSRRSCMRSRCIAGVSRGGAEGPTSISRAIWPSP
jgi:hypothetical protein